MHARIENGAVLEYPVFNLRQRFPDSSLPEDLTVDATLPEGYVYVSDLGEPPCDEATQAIDVVGAVLKDGQWTKSYAVRELTAQELSARADAAASQVRSERNRLLSSCDWTQVEDAPVDQAAWAAYRQSLRDITAQPDFPMNVNWPIQPE